MAVSKKKMCFLLNSSTMIQVSKNSQQIWNKGINHDSLVVFLLWRSFYLEKVSKRFSNDFCSQILKQKWYIRVDLQAKSHTYWHAFQCAGCIITHLHWTLQEVPWISRHQLILMSPSLLVTTSRSLQFENWLSSR